MILASELCLSAVSVGVPLVLNALGEASRPLAGMRYRACGHARRTDMEAGEWSGVDEGRGSGVWLESVRFDLVWSGALYPIDRRYLTCPPP